MKSNVKIALAVIALGILLSVTVVANKVYHKPKNTKAEIAGFAKVKKIKPLTANSAVPKVLDFIENSRHSWTSIYVEGYNQASTNPVNKFRAWVKRSGVYRLEEGHVIHIKNNKERWIITPPAKRAVFFEVVQPPKNKEEGLNKVIDTPLNDLINPSYFVRKELRQNVETVENIGITKIAGRSAIHLKVTFPKKTAKENYWDIYVDCKTGIILGRVIHSSSGNPEVKDFIDKVEINPMINPDMFTFVPPVGYKIN